MVQKLRGFDDRSSPVRANVRLDLEIYGSGVAGRGRWYWAARPLPYLFIPVVREGSDE